MENLRASEGLIQEQSSRQRGVYKAILPGNSDFEILIAPKLAPVLDHQNNYVSMKGEINGEGSFSGKDANRMIRMGGQKSKEAKIPQSKRKAPVIDI